MVAPPVRIQATALPIQKDHHHRQATIILQSAFGGFFSMQQTAQVVVEDEDTPLEQLTLPGIPILPTAHAQILPIMTTTSVTSTPSFSSIAH